MIVVRVFLCYYLVIESALLALMQLYLIHVVRSIVTDVKMHRVQSETIKLQHMCLSVIYKDGTHAVYSYSCNQ